ncbi:MAG: carbon-nitrogen hydrolase family protein [Pseudomonadota bacterium]
MSHKDGAPFQAACVQMRTGVDRDRGIDDALALIAEAADKGARFVATPEMTSVLDQNPKRLFADLPEPERAPELTAFSDAAQRHGVWLLIGSVAVKVGDRRAANRSLFFSPDGALIATYDKIHMFDVALPDGETWKESSVYEPGAAASVIETPLASFGLSICYDLRFPALYRALSQAGATVLCVPAAFTRQTGKAHWRTLLRARAIENGAFVIAPGQGGRHEDGRETFGGSAVIGPWGEVLCEADGDEPGVVLAKIDPPAAARARAAIPNLGLEAPFKILNLRA